MKSTFMVLTWNRGHVIAMSRNIDIINIESRSSHRIIKVHLHCQRGMKVMSSTYGGINKSTWYIILGL